VPEGGETRDGGARVGAGHGEHPDRAFGPQPHEVQGPSAVGGARGVVDDQLDERGVTEPRQRGRLKVALDRRGGGEPFEDDLVQRQRLAAALQPDVPAAVDRVRHRGVGTPAVHPTAVGPAPQEPSGGVAQPDRALGELGGGAREGVEAQVLLHQPVEHGDHADRALGVGVEGGETEQQCPHRSTLGRRGAAGESASWRVPNHPIPAVCRLPRSCDGEHHRGWAARRGRRPRRGR
jgi:hypothetical protein